MPEGYTVNPTTLANTASSLRKAGDALANIGRSPGAPDAGKVTGEMAAIMARFTEEAAQLVGGVSGAGDQVADSRNKYLAQEQAGSRTFGAR